MKNIFKNLIVLVLASTLFSSCVNDTFNTPVQENCVSPSLTKTKEVADLYATATNATQIYTDDDIIEAYVISSDEGGNFYKSMYFQPIDGSKGFNLSVDEVNAYTKNLQPGKRVFLRLKDLAYANPTGYGRGLIFGAPPTEIFAVDRLSGLSYKNFLIPTCDVVNEDDIVHHISLSQASSDTYLNTLVEIDDVQFSDETAGGTYDTDRTDNYDSSIYITNDGANSLTVRTSRFANFAGLKVPTGKGTLRGILARYNSTYQIILRTERDVNMLNERLDFNLPIGGTNIQYLSTFTEDFESYDTSSGGAIFPSYINDAFIGSRYWDVKSYSNNKYIQMTSYSSGGSNKTYLAIPVAFTPGNKLSFKSKDGYNKGDVLKVYYATNYVPGGDMSQATLVDITTSFTIASGSTSGYASNFTNSGDYVIPASLTGNGFFIFEYFGTSSITTTIQIDDIIVN